MNKDLKDIRDALIAMKEKAEKNIENSTSSNGGWFFTGKSFGLSSAVSLLERWIFDKETEEWIRNLEL